MMILNEKKYAEFCLSNRTLGRNPYITLSILAKYYYYVCGYKKKKIIEELTAFIEKYYNKYKPNHLYWDENIEKLSNSVKKHPLFEADYVCITDNEINTIQSIHNKVLERLAFTLLCIAKLNSLKNPNNNGWVNAEAKEVFSLARISCNAYERYARLCELNSLGLLEFPKKNDNLNCRVTYINNEGKVAVRVDDFRELGYEYLKYCGAPLIKCQECGKLIRNNKYGNKKYCSDCAVYVPKEYKTVRCADCGKEFEVAAKNNNTFCCDECYTIYRRKYKAEKERERRNKQKCGDV